MENYDKLKSIIQQANPKIMELKFGCEILSGNELHTVIKPPHYYGSDEMITICGRMMRDWQISPYKPDILGRPIRLADVLLAIASELPRSDSYFVDADGGFHEWFSPKGRLDLRTVSQWNLKDDNLDHQSDETKQFLIDLLVQ